MDFRGKKDVPNPRSTTNPISKLFFLWIIPLFRKGRKKDLDIDDLFNCLDEDKSSKVGDRLEIEWDKECARAKLKGTHPKYYRAIWKTFGSDWIWLSFFLCIDEWIFRVAQNIFIRLVILSFSDGSTDAAKYYYAGGLCISTLLHTSAFHPIMTEFLHLGMKCRVSSCSLIYRKTLKLSKSAQGKTTVGQLINLLSNDVSRFDYYLLFLPYIYIGPIQTLIFGYFLWVEFGWSTLAGMSIIIMMAPIQYYIGTKNTEYRGLIAKRTDERGRILNEIINAMRVIKMYAWEVPFSKMIHKLRQFEIKIIKKSSFLRALYLSLYVTSGKLTAYLTFIIYILVEDEFLTADKVFFAVSTYNVIRQVMISFLPLAAAGAGELTVSLSRIETFLLLDDHKPSDNFESKEILERDEEPEVVMKNVSASWTEDKVTLKDLTLDLKGDKLVMVVGSVGSGKTSFLHALISELKLSQGGKCFVKGVVTYSGQEPWIFGGNLRQNILFGSEFNQEWYDEVVQVCALEEDLKQLPHGENTIVGDRGVALSGGQKARVNLARSLYKKADIYLMDDPLSAVDSRVSRHIFDKCIKNKLKGHLRILVTHQLQYLPQADHIIVLDEGHIVDQGQYEDLVKRGVDFVSLMASESAEDTKKKSATKEVIEKIPEKAKESGDKPKSQAETSATGSVEWKTYFEYFKVADSTCNLITSLFLYFFCQLLYSFGDWWLSYWTSEEVRISKEGENADDSFTRDELLYIYSGIILATIIFTKIKSIHFFAFCMRIGVNVHNRMFQSLVRAPVKFFDENPSGRIMNRFTKDLGSMDELLPASFYDAATIFLLMIGLLIVIGISNYYTIGPTVVFVICLWLVRNFYIKSSRDIKRCEALTRSPIFTHVSASVQGLTTIRTSKTEKILVEQFDLNQDMHSATWYLFITANRGFGIWLELISVVYIAIIVFSFLLFLSDANVGNVGLAISSVLNLIASLQWGMRQSSEVENLMTSVERALEYVNIDPEASLESKPEQKPPKNWPQNGEISFEKVSLAYEDKDVLKELNFGIKSREKIGIVGRTGAGKSSIIAALFRMTEPRGNIYIDGVKINDIGLHDLRKSISIIPQDPILFSGTMRYNLDPFDQFKDEELWKVLEEVNLKSEVPALDFKVSDGGSNFSVGQRQLICLARAILRNNKIIVMDEATANVDPLTDNFIQKTIRSKFDKCSIITIAHRLHSVMDCDRILVLDNGYVEEYDHPYTLLQKPDGILTSMVNFTGRSSSVVLRQIASDKLDRDNELLKSTDTRRKSSISSISSKKSS